MKSALRMLVGAVLVAALFISTAAYSSEVGIASVYGSESGKRRADGKPFRPSQIGCAHRTRRLGSVVPVTNLANGRRILCPINDRGPFVGGRILDLSTGAARALSCSGLCRIRIE